MQGLDAAFNVVVPETAHRWCVRHMYGNFKTVHKGKALKDLLWNAARAPNVADFECEMEKMRQLEGGNAAYDWLRNKDTNKWARHIFSTRIRCDMLLNNLCECFNAWIIEARDKPILTMLEMIRCHIMRRLQAKRESMSRHEQPICPKIQNKLDKFKTLARKYVPMYSGNGLFQVVIE